MTKWWPTNDRKTTLMFQIEMIITNTQRHFEYCITFDEM